MDLDSLDLNDYDDPSHTNDPEIIGALDRQAYIDNLKENFRQQFIELENLGENLLNTFKDDLKDKDKCEIFTELVKYVDKHYVTIADMENLDDGVDRILTGGKYIYEFICVDNIMSLLPALMELLNVSSVDEFDGVINAKYADNIGVFRKDYLKTIQITIDQLTKLQNLSPNVIKDDSYQSLLGKYYYYQDIIEYGDMEMFLNNYVRPVINKFQGELLWKMF